MCRMGDRISGTVADVAVASAFRGGRRLSDRILAAFHHACDQGDYETADELLVSAERAISRTSYTIPADRRRSREALVAAYERLWHLRHRYE